MHVLNATSFFKVENFPRKWKTFLKESLVGSNPTKTALLEILREDLWQGEHGLQSSPILSFFYFSFSFSFLLTTSCWNHFYLFNIWIAWTIQSFAYRTLWNKIVPWETKKSFVLFFLIVVQYLVSISLTFSETCRSCDVQKVVRFPFLLTYMMYWALGVTITFVWSTKLICFQNSNERSDKKKRTYSIKMNWLEKSCCWVEIQLHVFFVANVEQKSNLLLNCHLRVVESVVCFLCHLSNL